MRRTNCFIVNMLLGFNTVGENDEAWGGNTIKVVLALLLFAAWCFYGYKFIQTMIQNSLAANLPGMITTELIESGAFCLAVTCILILLIVSQWRYACPITGRKKISSNNTFVIHSCFMAIQFQIVMFVISFFISTIIWHIHFEYWLEKGSPMIMYIMPFFPWLLQYLDLCIIPFKGKLDYEKNLVIGQIILLL